MKITQKTVETKKLHEIKHGHLFKFADSKNHAVKLGKKYLLLQSSFRTPNNHPTGLFLWDREVDLGLWDWAKEYAAYDVVDLGLWDIEATEFIVGD